MLAVVRPLLLGVAQHLVSLAYRLEDVRDERCEGAELAAVEAVRVPLHASLPEGLLQCGRVIAKAHLQQVVVRPFGQFRMGEDHLLPKLLVEIGLLDHEV